MSDRPTPRTAKAMMELPGRCNSIWVVPAEIACDLESELGDAIRERDEAREALKALAPLTYHDCSFYKDIMGNCIICKKEETK